ncbi:MAG: amino acid permease [Acidobacteriaceae bacterium]|nr:amino acid permease [Acidobacteriaceae bacterium]
MADAARPQLRRDLGVAHATAIVVGTVIGSGIFLVPAEMMQAVGSAGLVYLAWVVGGMLSFFGALTYSELGAMKPEAGGEYVYIRDAYGPLMAFLYAWTWFVVAKPASIASITAGLVRILGTFSIFSFLPKTAFVAGITVTYGELVAIAAAILITALNYIGVRKAGDFQLAFTVLKVAIVIGIVVAGFTATSGTWSHFRIGFAGTRGGVAGFVAALVAALWAYDGWNDLNMVSGEVRRPARTIPMALIGGMGLVAVLYMLMNAAVQYVLTPAAVAASQRPASDAFAAAVGPWGAAVVSAGMAISMLVTLNGTVMSGGRVPFAVARDGYFFSTLATVHPRFRTPSASLVLQAVIAIVLLLFAGSFRQLFSLAIFAEWLFYMIATSTIFVLRRREPAAERPYRAWGYPVVPALFIVASAVLLYFTFVENLRNSLAGMIVIVAGVPVFVYFARQRGRIRWAHRR